MITKSQFENLLNILKSKGGVSDEDTLEMLRFEFLEMNDENHYPKEISLNSNFGLGSKLKQRSADSCFYVSAYPECQTSVQAERMKIMQNDIRSVYGTNY